ncbi:hypothetical protein [Dyadobacter sp. LHD-138]|uniref:hypothetical protein n=1 Tax=Dyadobacter sp. LHD-138 TaxID=3071413 RepID=UPI0027E0F906|nr:hypothetical protein [Dyadobacter sp. LHD-138]MDQ6477246.1 hypothetical protein [Dyadobacter sp. LHD-138]
MPVTDTAGVPTKGAADHLLTKIYLANMEFDKAVSLPQTQGRINQNKGYVGADRNAVPLETVA